MELRTLTTLEPVVSVEESQERSYIVEGFALRYEPYVLGYADNIAIYEKFERGCLDGVDLSDVIMQYDHEGDVIARVSNGTLEIEDRNEGLYVRADLSKTARAREVHEQIATGMVTKMSWRFRVAEAYFNRETRTRHVTKIKSVFDVSPVSIPANDATVIEARSLVDDFLALPDTQQRRQQELRMRLKLQTLDIKEEMQP